MTGVRRVGRCLAALLLLTTAPGAAQPPDAQRCAAPAELLASDGRLPIVAAALTARQPVSIVAIGGASTAGLAAGDPALTYPQVLQDILRQRYPGSAITVLNLGVPRQTAAEMAERFDRAVVTAHPALVLWETGTNDAVQHADVDLFAATLREGIQRLHAAHADVMLLNMQFARETASVINFDPYLDVLQEVGELEQVTLFRRFEIMRYWSQTGAFAYDAAPRGQTQALAAAVYGCLALQLADAIGLAIAAPPP
jgi:hypothetical protein